jgi:hypothetical protein
MFTPARKWFRRMAREVGYVAGTPLRALSEVKTRIDLALDTLVDTFGTLAGLPARVVDLRARTAIRIWTDFGPEPLREPLREMARRIDVGDFAAAKRTATEIIRQIARAPEAQRGVWADEVAAAMAALEREIGPPGTWASRPETDVERMARAGGWFPQDGDDGRPRPRYRFPPNGGGLNRFR